MEQIFLNDEFKRFNEIYVNNQFKHLLIIHDKYSLLLVDYEGNILQKIQKLVPIGYKLNNIVFDSKSNILLISSSEKILQFYYPSDGKIIFQKNLIEFKLSIWEISLYYQPLE